MNAENVAAEMKGIELSAWKKKAAKLYRSARIPGYMDCGRKFAEYIRPDIGIARKEFCEVWEKIKQIDPNAPENPFERPFDSREGIDVGSTKEIMDTFEGG